MEFYKSYGVEKIAKKAFQFPTGWNSTLVPCSTRSLSRVSIPNGMEFYLSTLRCAEWIPCFNSQRDGILRKIGSLIASLVNCFNSQRDGILRLGFGPGVALGAVSIPNGMEFYLCKILGNLHTQPFQFPTGWNSTNSMYPSQIMALFQFPTGWNSTLL